MKKILTILLILFSLPGSVFSQKTEVKLNRSHDSSGSSWLITNPDGNVVVSCSDFPGIDSALFLLDADRQYSLRIIIDEPGLPVVSDYTLAVDEENILKINAQLSAGEHEYMFITGTKKPEPRIIGGVDAPISEFPWMVYFKASNYRCGGTIISPDWILTAAHCTEDKNNISIPVAYMSIVAGTSTPLSGGFTHYVSSVFRHPAYNHSTFENDIALIKLKTPIANTISRPIRIASAYDIKDGAILPGVMAWVTGWGLVNVTPQVVASYLQKVQLPIVSNSVAAEVWGNIPYTDIMAGYHYGTKDACSGDSGGPMIVPVSGEYKIAGIVSWGAETCNTYGGYTKVSMFADWISQVTGIPDYRTATPDGNAVICNLSDTTSYGVDPYPGGLNYEWKLFPEYSGTILPDSLNSRVIWSKSYSGQCQVMVRTKVNNVVSDWSKLKVLVNPLRKILSVSPDIQICKDGNVTMNIDAQGYDLHYTWLKDDEIINTGSPEIVLSAVQTVNAGSYRCEVSNICGTTYSDRIKLDVMLPTSITGLSHNLDISFGDNASLEVTSSGHQLTYEWQKDGVDLAEGNDAVLHFYDVNANDVGLYRVTVKGTCGTVTSDSIYVFVNGGMDDRRELLVWPTVTSDKLDIAFNGLEPYQIQVYNITGSLIKDFRNCTYKTTLYLNQLTPGTYIVNVLTKTFRKSVRIFKK